MNLSNLQLIEAIGSGIAGVVYKVIYKKKAYALKICDTSESKENIEEEINMNNLLKHKYIIKIIQTFSDNINTYILSELATNGEISNFIDENKITDRGIKRLMYQVALGIEYMTSKSIVHGDIKPDNILILNGDVKICDFGWAHNIKDQSANPFGTIDYIAPEVIKKQIYDCKVDVWSFAITFYVIITSGEHPFDADENEIDKDIIFSQILNNNYIPLSKESFPLLLPDLLKKCLVKNPLKRLSIKQVLEHPYFNEFYSN